MFFCQYDLKLFSSLHCSTVDCKGSTQLESEALPLAVYLLCSKKSSCFDTEAFEIKQLKQYAQVQLFLNRNTASSSQGAR